MERSLSSQGLLPALRLAALLLGITAASRPGLARELLSRSAELTAESRDAFRLDYSGYLQEQVISAGEFGGRSFTLGQTRSRLVLDATFHKKFSAEFSQTLAADYGSALINPVYALSAQAPPPTYFRWDHSFYPGKDPSLDWSVYRAYGKYENAQVSLILGRQRIAFGTALFYSPMDLFNPVSPLALEPEERVGVDAAFFEARLAQFTYLDLAYGVGDLIDESRFAVQAKTTVHSYDLSLLGARIFEDWIAGGAFSGYLKAGGLYGEMTYTMPETGSNYLRATLGYQYSFANSVNLVAEYYHNDGVLAPATPGLVSSFLAGQAGLATLHRNFLGLSSGIDYTALVRLSGAVLFDLDYGSFFLGPALTYSAPYSITLTLGAQLFSGGPKSEFGFLPDFYYARLRWNF